MTVGAPLFAGTIIGGVTLLSATPAYADGPAEAKQFTGTFLNSDGDSVNCTLRLTITTNFQNNTKQDQAGWSITNTPACRNATVDETLGWTTPNGGSAGSHESFFAPDTPASFVDVYEPVHPTASIADFTETVGITFNDCQTACSFQLSLTADAKA